MIGQQHLQSRIDHLIENGTFPRFSIFVGPKGSGKKTLAHLVYQKFGTGMLSNIGISVDAVRQCIAQSYTVRGSQVIYLFADACHANKPDFQKAKNHEKNQPDDFASPVF